MKLYSCDWSLVTEPSLYTVILQFAVGFLNGKLDLWLWFAWWPFSTVPSQVFWQESHRDAGIGLGIFRTPWFVWALSAGIVAELSPLRDPSKTCPVPVSIPLCLSRLHGVCCDFRRHWSMLWPAPLSVWFALVEGLAWTWQANFWNSTLTQDRFYGLSTYLSTVLGQFVTELHSRLPALFTPALHKALSYLLFFLHFITGSPQGTVLSPILFTLYHRLSTRHCPISYSFYTLSPALHKALSYLLFFLHFITGSPQGTVLSPILFTLYHRLSTRHCPISYSFCTLYKWLHRHWHIPIIKYSDDFAMEDLSNSDSVYFFEVERFSNWCRDIFLDLNVKITKEMLIDFRKAPTVIPGIYWWRGSWKSDRVQISENSFRQQAEF